MFGILMLEFFFIVFLMECVEAQSPPRVRVWNSHKPNGVLLGFFLPSSRECVQ